MDKPKHSSRPFPLNHSQVSISTLILVNIFSLTFYIAFFKIMGLTVSEHLMFSTPDSRSYLEVANWIAHGTNTTYTEIRPFLYPFIILLTTTKNSIIGLWLIQLFFWLLTINFTFLSIYKLTTNYFLSFAGTIILLSNLSLIALTTHALTEVFTTFLLGFLLFILINNGKKQSEPINVSIIVGILVLLTLTKPVFLIPLIISLAIIPIFYLRKYLNDPRQFLLLFIFFLPLIAQISIMKIKHNTYNIAMIGPLTFRSYFLAKGIETVEGVERPESIQIARDMSNIEIIHYLKTNSAIYIDQFYDNLVGNIKSRPTYLRYPDLEGPDILYNLMRNLNKSYFYIHIIMQIESLFALTILFKKKEYYKISIILCSFFLVDFYLLTTGISFFQGDRLVLPTIAVWPVFYSFTISILMESYASHKHSPSN